MLAVLVAALSPSVSIDCSALADVMLQYMTLSCVGIMLCLQHAQQLLRC